MPHGTRIAELLLSIGAVKLSLDPPFTWTSGLKSPIYCDNRMVYSHPEARKFVVDALAQRVSSLPIPPDAIAGTATAAIGWAAMVADKLELPFAYVRAEAKGHGAKKRVEGDLKPGQHVVLLEDLFSTAGSAVSSIQALREECESIVTDAVGIFSYEFTKAADRAAEAQVKLHPLSNISVLTQVAREQGALSEEDVERVLEFVKNPQEWKV